MDKFSAEQRHKTMAAIHSKDTKPEMIVRKGLWSKGFRYRLNSPRLPGHPDIAFGMGMRVAARYLIQIGIFGWRRSSGIRKGILRRRSGWRRWVGIALPSGSVN